MRRIALAALLVVAFAAAVPTASAQPAGHRSPVYTVCVRFPTGRSLCAKEQNAERGVLYVNKVTSSQLGVHRITWFVKGRQVGRFLFRIGASRS